jgi:hypothetical protein
VESCWASLDRIALAYRLWRRCVILQQRKLPANPRSPPISAFANEEHRKTNLDEMRRPVSKRDLWEKPSPRPQVDGKEETHFRAGRRRSRSLHLVGRFTIGLDLGDRSTAFCVLDGDGTIVAEGKFKTTQVAIDQQLASLAPARVALEAGTHPGWISRLIESYGGGHEVIVANPREVRKIYQNDRKNDRSDAQILARLARFDPQLLEPIFHRTASMQADLATIRARETLVTARTKCVNAMRGLVNRWVRDYRSAAAITS